MALTIQERTFGRKERTLYSVCSGRDVLVGRGHAASEDLAVCLHQSLGISERKEKPVVIAEHFVLSFPNKSFCRLIEESISSLEIFDKHGIGGPIHDGL